MSRKSACSSKKRFRTVLLAQERCDQINDNRPQPEAHLEPYQCDHCGKFHLRHIVNRRQWAELVGAKA